MLTEIRRLTTISLKVIITLLSLFACAQEQDTSDLTDNIRVIYKDSKNIVLEKSLDAYLEEERQASEYWSKYNDTADPNSMLNIKEKLKHKKESIETKVQELRDTVNEIKQTTTADTKSEHKELAKISKAVKDSTQKIILANSDTILADNYLRESHADKIAGLFKHDINKIRHDYYENYTSDFEYLQQESTWNILYSYLVENRVLDTRKSHHLRIDPSEGIIKYPEVRELLINLEKDADELAELQKRAAKSFHDTTKEYQENFGLFLYEKFAKHYGCYKENKDLKKDYESKDFLEDNLDDVLTASWWFVKNKNPYAEDLIEEFLTDNSDIKQDDLVEYRRIPNALPKVAEALDRFRYKKLSLMFPEKNSKMIEINITDHDGDKELTIDDIVNKMYYTSDNSHHPWTDESKVKEKLKKLLSSKDPLYKKRLVLKTNKTLVVDETIYLAELILDDDTLVKVNESSDTDNPTVLHVGTLKVSGNKTSITGTSNVKIDKVITGYNDKIKHGPGNSIGAQTIDTPRYDLKDFDAQIEIKNYSESDEKEQAADKVIVKNGKAILTDGEITFKDEDGKGERIKAGQHYNILEAEQGIEGSVASVKVINNTLDKLAGFALEVDGKKLNVTTTSNIYSIAHNPYAAIIAENLDKLSVLLEDKESSDLAKLYRRIREDYYSVKDEGLIQLEADINQNLDRLYPKHLYDVFNINKITNHKIMSNIDSRSVVLKDKSANLTKTLHRIRANKPAKSVVLLDEQEESIYKISEVKRFTELEEEKINKFGSYVDVEFKQEFYKEGVQQNKARDKISSIGAGIDFASKSNVFLGAFIQVNNGNKYNNDLRVRNNNVTFGLYNYSKLDLLDITSYLAYGYDKYSIERTSIDNKKFLANPSGEHVLGAIKTKYMYCYKDKFFIVPYVTLTLNSSSIKAYSESVDGGGASDFALNYQNDPEYIKITANYGLDFSYKQTLGENSALFKFKPSLLYTIHEEVSDNIKANFIGFDKYFIIDDNLIDNTAQSALVRLGLECVLANKNGFSLYAGLELYKALKENYRLLDNHNLQASYNFGLRLDL